MFLRLKMPQTRFDLCLKHNILKGKSSALASFVF